MKRRLLPLCTALVLCLLLAPAAWAAVYPYPPIETLHIGSHDGTEIQKDTYYLVRGETVTTQGANADNYNIYYKDGTLTLRAAALPDYLLVPGETTIHLVGENTIGTKDSPTDVGIQGVTPGAITITGPGSCSIHSSAEGIITVQPDSATDPQVTSDIRLQGGTINTNGSSISTRYGGICITGSAQVTAGSLSTGGDPNMEEAQRARDLVISGRASVTAERLVRFAADSDHRVRHRHRGKSRRHCHKRQPRDCHFRAGPRHRHRHHRRSQRILRPNHH